MSSPSGFMNSPQVQQRALAGKWYIPDTSESQHQYCSPKLFASTTQNSGDAQYKNDFNQGDTTRLEYTESLPNSGSWKSRGKSWLQLFLSQETPRFVGSIERGKHAYKRVTFSISGNCSSCYSVLESTFNTTLGVRNVTLESDRRTVECDIDLSITSVHDVTSSVQDASRHLILHGYYDCGCLKLDPPMTREAAENLLTATFLKA